MPNYSVSNSFLFENTTLRSFSMAFNVSNFSEFNKYHSDSHPEQWPLIIHEEFTIVLLCFVYGLIFIIALIGNSLVICVVLKNPGMRNVTNVFIVNLAVADILVTLFCMPLTLLDNIFSGKCMLLNIKLNVCTAKPAWKGTYIYHITVYNGHLYITKHCL